MENKKQRAEIIADVAQKLGTRPEWLDALINFETGGTYDPTIKNPNSSARGLIQVIDRTAQDEFGVLDSLELVAKNPDFRSQMYNVVLPYLKKYAPFEDKQSLYMAVFYPKYRYVSPETEFPAYVQRVNPGIRKVQDYIDFVDARIKEDTLHFPFSTAPILIAGIIGAILIYRHVTG